MALVSAHPPAVADRATHHQRLEQVDAFVAAFNRQDANAMAALVTDDICWLSINGKAVATEVSGKQPLVAAMNDYFAACPSCRSTLGPKISSGHVISVVETAAWQGAEGPQSQQSVAVYTFDGQRISRVYYFPAEPVE